MKIVVFSNNFPNIEQLSADRWEICKLGEGEFTNMDKSAIVSPKTKYPFIEPLALPELSESFDLREFLENRISDGQGLLEIPLNPNATNIIPMNPVNLSMRDEFHYSQTAGPARENPPGGGAKKTASHCVKHPNNGELFKNHLVAEIII